MTVLALSSGVNELALAVFAEQAKAIGALFTITANLTDPDGYFLGGGVVEAAPEFRDWFLEQVQSSTRLRTEQADVATFALVPDRDMAGARGAALAAAGFGVGTQTSDEADLAAAIS